MIRSITQRVLARGRNRRIASVTVGLVAGLAATLVVSANTAVEPAAQPLRQQPLSQPAAQQNKILASSLAKCADVSATVSTFHSGQFGDFMENLEFDGHGTMWVANLLKNRIERYTPNGERVASVDVRAPGAMRMGPDGMLYANSGDGILDDNLLPLKRAGVYKINPTASTLTASAHTTGLRVANGAAFDSAGNLYVSNSGVWGKGMVKIRPNGEVDQAWSDQIDFRQGNGVAIIGNSLYTTLTYDLSSPVLRVPLDRPSEDQVVVRYSAPDVPKFLDDISVGPDGMLYVAGHVSGQIIRLNPSNGESCVIADGFTSLTSVRFARDFGSFNGQLFATEGVPGKVKRVQLTRR
jgi:sugar lactone lactonase YvrE